MKGGDEKLCVSSNWKRKKKFEVGCGGDEVNGKRNKCFCAKGNNNNNLKKIVRVKWSNMYILNYNHHLVYSTKHLNNYPILFLSIKSY